MLKYRRLHSSRSLSNYGRQVQTVMIVLGVAQLLTKIGLCVCRSVFFTAHNEGRCWLGLSFSEALRGLIAEVQAVGRLSISSLA